MRRSPPTLSPLGGLSGHDVDRAHAEVSASFAGLAQARAIDRGPLGCLVLHGEPPAPVTLPPLAPAPPLCPTSPAAGSSTRQPALKRATGPSPRRPPAHRNTKAVVVVQMAGVSPRELCKAYGIETR